MKKTKFDLYPKMIITTLVVLLTTTGIQAQESIAGIKGGVNLSYLSIENVDDNNILPGFHAGVFTKVMITDKFAVQPEILFSRKGVKTTYEGFADGESKLKTSYIDVPLYLTFNLSEDFDFHFGPYVGFLLKSSIDTDAEVLDFIDVDSNDDIDNGEFNSLDYGLSAGLGFNFDQFSLGFNYNLGLRQVAKDGEAMENLLGNAKNNTIQVYIGLTF